MEHQLGPVVASGSLPEVLSIHLRLVLIERLSWIVNRLEVKPRGGSPISRGLASWFNDLFESGQPEIVTVSSRVTNSLRKSISRKQRVLVFSLTGVRRPSNFIRMGFKSVTHGRGQQLTGASKKPLTKRISLDESIHTVYKPLRPATTRTRV